MSQLDIKRRDRNLLRRVARLFDTKRSDLRAAFLGRTLAALKNISISSYGQLHKAIRENASELDSELVDLPANNWQGFYQCLPSTLESRLWFMRALGLVHVLLPAFRGERIVLLADPFLFDVTTKHPGIGELYERPLRTDPSQAFSAWLNDGKPGPLSKQDYEGEYVAYFPWLAEDEAGLGYPLACAKSRLYLSGDVWIFESFGHVNGFGPRLFTGQLRFTGSDSVTLVGFSSFVLPVSRSSRVWSCEKREMLVHPHRIPSSLNGWWHGATTFIDPTSGGYKATVPHVMRRTSSVVPEAAAWLAKMHRPMALLGSRDPGYDAIKDELSACPLAREAHAFFRRKS